MLHAVARFYSKNTWDRVLNTVLVIITVAFLAYVCTVIVPAALEVNTREEAYIAQLKANPSTMTVEKVWSETSGRSSSGSGSVGTIYYAAIDGQLYQLTREQIAVTATAPGVFCLVTDPRPDKHVIILIQRGPCAANTVATPTPAHTP